MSRLTVGTQVILLTLCALFTKIPQIIQNTELSKQYMCWYAWGEINIWISVTSLEVSKKHAGVMAGVDRKQEQRMFTVTSGRWGSLRNSFNFSLH